MLLCECWQLSFPVSHYSHQKRSYIFWWKAEKRHCPQYFVPSTQLPLILCSLMDLSLESPAARPCLTAPVSWSVGKAQCHKESNIIMLWLLGDTLIFGITIKFLPTHQSFTQKLLVFQCNFLYDLGDVAWSFPFLLVSPPNLHQLPEKTWQP